MSCNTSASFFLQYPWVAPGINEQPYLDPPTNTVKNIRTFSEWVTVLDLTGSLLCTYMEDFPSWFVETPAPGLVTSWTGADGDTRVGAVVADAGDYDDSMVTASGLVPGATLEDQLNYLLSSGGGSGTVVDSVQATVPGGPSVGERVLLTSIPNQYSIAEWDGASWSYTPTTEGQTIVSKANAGYVYVRESGGISQYQYDTGLLFSDATDLQKSFLIDKIDIVGYTGSIVAGPAGNMLRFSSGGGSSGGAFPIAMYQDAGGSNTFPSSGGWVDIQMPVTLQSNPDISQSGAEFTFNAAGDYFASFKCAADTGASRTQMIVKLQRDGGGGYADVAGSEAYGYSTNTYQDLQTAATGLIPIPAVLVGEKLKASAILSAGMADEDTAASGAAIVIFRMQSASGGATAFTDLTDVPSSYSGDALKVVRVNAGETGLEFATVSGTGDVVGPASSTDDSLARYDGTTGKLLKDGLPYSSGGNFSADGGKIVQYGDNGNIVATGELGTPAAQFTADDYYALVATSANAIAARFRTLDPADTEDIARFENQYGNGMRFKNDGAISWSGGGEVNTRINLGLGTAAVEDAATTSAADAIVQALGTGKIDLSWLTIGAAASTDLLDRAAGDARYQPLDSDLTAIAALSTTSFGRGLLTEASAASLRSTAGLVIGTNVQAWDTDLDGLAALTWAANKFPYVNGSAVKAMGDITSFALTFLDDATAGDVRNTLGLGSMATQDTAAVNITGGSITGITDLAIADGGTGASTASGARANLGLTTIVLGSNYSNSGTGAENVTGLSFSATAGETYNVSIVGTWRGNNTTNNPAFGFQFSSGGGNISFAGNRMTTTAPTFNQLGASAATAASASGAATITAATDMPFQIQAAIECTSSGTVNFTIQVPANTTTIKTPTTMKVSVGG